MKVAILSDIHDNIWNLDRALHLLAEVDVVVCCGDLCSPFVVDRLGKGFSGPIHVVFGNNDGDLFRITQKASQYPHMKLHGEFTLLELDGKTFAVNHFDNIGRALAAQDVYDVVCFGHNHRYEVRRGGKTLLINPGEIMGGLSEGPVATFVIYDTTSGEVERVVV